MKTAIRPHTRTLRIAAEHATSATEICRIVSELAQQGRVETATQLLAQHWYPHMTGKRSTELLLKSLLNQFTNVGWVDHERALRLIGSTLMDTEERSACEALRENSTLSLYRATNYAMPTGWYLSKAVALEQWKRAKPPLAVETLTIRNGDILAVKIHKGVPEIVLTPGRGRHPDRDLLPSATEDTR